MRLAYDSTGWRARSAIRRGEVAEQGGDDRQSPAPDCQTLLIVFGRNSIGCGPSPGAAEEALGIAVYCALAAAGDFKRGVVLAVNHGGDSDSTGAITGNILGALLDVDAIPGRWLEQLEMREVIEQLADELCGS